MTRELITGVIALALAASYYAAADALPVSLLSDEVGADGVPKVLAVALGLCGLAQLLRAVLRRGANDGASESTGSRRHWRAAGLLLIAVVYVAAMPHVGYLLGTACLLLAVAAYAGQAWSLRLAAVSVAGAVALWLSFAKLLGVPMPPTPFV